MKNCKNCRYKGRPTYIDPCAGCHEFDKFELKSTTTNADRIRAMSDEELAEFINGIAVRACCDYCQLAYTDGACTETLCDDARENWLRQPAEVDT